MTKEKTIPVALAAQVAARDLEQAVWAKVGGRLLVDASWASDLLAVLAVQQIFQRVEAKVGARGSRIKRQLIVSLVDGRIVGTLDL